MSRVTRPDATLACCVWWLLQSAYGSPDDFRALVDKAHELGVAIMVDICLNHGSTRLNSLWMWDGFGPDNSGGIYFDKGGGREMEI
jgi:maltooligosyltrehalose synthase